MFNGRISGLVQTARHEQLTGLVAAVGDGTEITHDKKNASIDDDAPNTWDDIGDAAMLTWFNGTTVFGIYGT